ncbi:MAG: hypothetical protein ABIH03_08825, partial [Pseudomonadota bacterium]
VFSDSFQRGELDCNGVECEVPVSKVVIESIGYVGTPACPNCLFTRVDAKTGEVDGWASIEHRDRQGERLEITDPGGMADSMALYKEAKGGVITKAHEPVVCGRLVDYEVRDYTGVAQKDAEHWPNPAEVLGIAKRLGIELMTGWANDGLGKVVEQRGDQWCVIHCTGPDAGTPIKCFETRAEAEAMHRAIQARRSAEKTDPPPTRACECVDCEHKIVIPAEEHCPGVKCPKCGGEMRQARRSAEKEIDTIDSSDSSNSSTKTGGPTMADEELVKAMTALTAALTKQAEPKNTGAAAEQAADPVIERIDALGKQIGESNAALAKAIGEGFGMLAKALKIETAPAEPTEPAAEKTAETVPAATDAAVQKAVEAALRQYGVIAKGEPNPPAPPTPGTDGDFDPSDLRSVERAWARQIMGGY